MSCTRLTRFKKTVTYPLLKGATQIILKHTSFLLLFRQSTSSWLQLPTLYIVANCRLEGTTCESNTNIVYCQNYFRRKQASTDYFILCLSVCMPVFPFVWRVDRLKCRFTDHLLASKVMSYEQTFVQLVSRNLCTVRLRTHCDKYDDILVGWILSIYIS